MKAGQVIGLDNWIISEIVRVTITGCHIGKEDETQIKIQQAQAGKGQL